MFSCLFAALSALFAVTYAQNQGTAAVVCTAGQCLQGFTNITLGAKAAASQSPLPIFLLPGQYTSTTNPQLLHDILTSSSTSMTPSPGVNKSANTLPMSLSLQPGLAVFSEKLYGGQSGFQGVPSSPVSSNSSAMAAGSIAMSSNVWAAVTMGSNQRVVIWDSVPDVAQLPASLSGNASSFTLNQMESSQCSPPCTAAGICSSSGTCSCKPNFTGASCEECASGFFGPNCTACPSGCSSCDQGIAGSGRCLDNERPKTSLATCNCLNGQCSGDGGTCTCNAGWTTSDNGTACAKCSDGFFLSSTGECRVCSIGCTKCGDGTGECLQCKSGFSLDATDKTKCNPPQSTDNTGAVCPEGSFGNGSGACTPCDKACQTCSGGTSNDCTKCAAGSFLFNGQCVSADGNGLCQTGGGAATIADNNKGQCDGCPAKCTSCQIPNFSKASTSNQVQCSACQSGAILFQGKCVDSCPSGSFSDGKTCQTCDSSCSSCAEKATFCLSCPAGRLALNGTCVSTCPSGSTQAQGSSSCSTCHPDCATCSGPSFSQCSTCPPSNPVLSNGRCLSTCSKGEFFDQASASCKACDSSCSSCSGSGSNQCLACSSPNQVLRAGKCTDASCPSDGSGGSVLSGLGACLSELVFVPKASGTSPATPFPSVTGLSNPIASPPKQKLEWWQILLMALGCAFIFVIIVFLWRRRMVKKRQWETKVWARKRNLGQGWGWNALKLSWLSKLGRMRSRRARMAQQQQQQQDTELVRVKHTSWISYRDHDRAEKAKVDSEDEKMAIYDSYRASSSRSLRPSPRAQATWPAASGSSQDRLARSSVYSELTGKQRNTPEPRQPLKGKDLDLGRRISPPRSRSPTYRDTRASSLKTRSVDTCIHSDDGSSYQEPLINLSSTHDTPMPQPSFLQPYRSASPTPAQEFASTVKPALAAAPPLPGTAHWLSTMQEASASSYSLVEHPTGNSTSTTMSRNNPFRRP